MKTCNLPATVNITREEKRALDDLTKNKEVTIVPADKGRSVVVMDKDEYQDKVSVLLNDTNTYLKITDKRSSPTSSVEKDLNKLLLNIKEEKNDSGTQIGPALYRNYIAAIQHPRRFMVSRKFISLKDHSDPIPAAYVASRTPYPNILFPFCPLFGETASLPKTAQILLKRSSNILSPVTKSWFLLMLNLYSFPFPWI